MAFTMNAPTGDGHRADHVVDDSCVARRVDAQLDTDPFGFLEDCLHRVLFTAVDNRIRPVLPGGLQLAWRGADAEHARRPQNFRHLYRHATYRAAPEDGHRFSRHLADLQSVQSHPQRLH